MKIEHFTTCQITDLESFREAREPWNRLAGNHPFLRWEWLFSWWEAFHEGRKLSILIVKDASDHWVAAAPWYITHSASLGRVVQNLGNGAACSDYSSWLVRPGRENAAAQIAASLIADPSGPFAQVDLFDLEGFSGNDVPMDFLLRALESHGLELTRTEMAATWRTALDSSWESFNARLSKSFRRKTKKAQTRLNNSQLEKISLETAPAIEDRWDEFVRLHQLRRESVGQAGCFADPDFEKFLKSAILRLAECDKARIHLMHWAGEPYAADLEFTSENDVLMYQTGMDPKFSHEEPGHTLFTWAIQRAIENGRDRFDFLRGDEPYKQRWNSERIPLYRVHAVPARWTSQMRHGIWSTGQSVKNWARSILHKQVT